MSEPDVNHYVDSVGSVVPIDSLPQALAYNGDGTLNTITAGPDVMGRSWMQTYSYTAGVLTGISAWVKQ